MRSLAWILPAAVLAGSLSPALAAPLALPEAENAVDVTEPYTRVTVTADNAIEHAGKTMSVGSGLVIPALLAPLQAYRAAEPTGLVLVAGDRGADFRAVRIVLDNVRKSGLNDVGFLVSPDGAAPRALRVTQTFAFGDPLVEPDRAPPLPQLIIHLVADQLVFLRGEEGLVIVPREDGRLDLAALSALLDEDRRLHPSARFVIINTDDGVAYADMIATLDRTRGKGYTRTLLSGGPAMPTRPDAKSIPTPPEGPVEQFASVRFHPNGDTDLRAADGSVDLVRRAVVAGYDAHCDASVCDLVLRTGTRRLHLGARPRNAPFADRLFGRPVQTWDGRLNLPEPVREGVLSPLFARVGEDSPEGGEPLVLGSLDKALIDGVMKENMDQVSACYSELLERFPERRARATMKFAIGRDGTVSRAIVKESDIDDAPFHTCLTDALRTFEFAEPKGGGIVYVTYPFVFSPG
ncbi:MAG: AgmX/PglI C-terminal domain-containing protein [Myxococcota bacterium]